MIIYHPYRPLLQYITDLEKDEKDGQFLKISWLVTLDPPFFCGTTLFIYFLSTFLKLLFTHRRLINDSLRTDVSILFPPYCIALAAIYMTAVYLKVDAKDWFAELNVDMDVVSVTSYLKIRHFNHVS